MADTKVNVQNSCAVIWLIGWLFTIGFAKLTFWTGLLGIILWPYYLGDIFSKMIK